MLRIILLTCCLSIIAASEFQVITVDAQRQRVPKIVFSDDHLVLGDKQLALLDVTEIERVEDGSARQAWGSNGVLLQDGSWLPATALVGAKDDDVIQLATPFGVLYIPLEYVAAWGAYEQLQISAEYDYLILNNGNKPFGELIGSNDGHVLLQTSLSPEALRIPIDDIRALRLRSQKQTIQGLYIQAFTHTDRPPLKLRPGKKPSLALIEKVELNDWDAFSRLEVFSSARTFLGAVSPTQVVEKGMFGKVWPYAVNKNISGSPLYLNERRYEYGIVMHSYAKISWPLLKEYTSFRCRLGISDLLGREGNCAVRIFADDKELWANKSVCGQQTAHEIDLKIAGAKELTIEVDYGERYDIGDHVLIANPFLH